ncbi:MAG: hypothetical protein ACI9GW_002512 [Halieaceae bacterium]|jgi:hypothetical protein
MRDNNFVYAAGTTQHAPFQVIDDLVALGFPGNVAVAYDIQFHRYLVAGDRVHHFKTVESISELKITALGEGYFFTDREEYFDQNDELFAEAKITYFQYRPTNPKPAKINVGQPATSPVDTDLNLEVVAPHFDLHSSRSGDGLPRKEVPITHALIVGGALAGQDFTAVHHNLPAAQAAGTQDIFMNILTTGGLTTSYLTGWAGPSCRLERLVLKLMGPNFPGDTMVYSGAIDTLQQTTDGVSVEVSFAGHNARGPHVTGCATLQIGT